MKREDKLGMFSVGATVSHPEHPESRLSIDLLVDTGATWSLIPSGVAHSLGIEPFRIRPVRTAEPWQRSQGRTAICWSTI